MLEINNMTENKSRRRGVGPLSGRRRSTKDPKICQSKKVFLLLLMVLSLTWQSLFVGILVDAKRSKSSSRLTRSLKSVVPKRISSCRGGGSLTKNKQSSKQVQTSPTPSPTAQSTTSNESTKESSPPPNPSKPDPKEDDPRILMLIRLLFMAYYGSLGSLLPYLPVYYHSLGHGGQIIGMLGAIKPFTTFLVAPFWGIVSDKTASPFTVLQINFLVSLVGQLLVAWKHDPTYIMVMIFITAFFNAPVKSLIDSMVMSHLNDRSRYGRLRLWGQLGFGIGSSGVGVLLSRSKHQPYNPPEEGDTLFMQLDKFWQSITSYKLLFFTYALLSVPTWMCIRAFYRLHNENESKSVKSSKESSAAQAKAGQSVGIWDGIRVLFHNSDALLFFFLVLAVGISSGVIENFAYVRIREVGGTGKDMGLSRLVSSLAGAPMFWFSGPLTEKLGADKVIVLSLLSYVLRFFIYAMMQSPLQGLPAEAMRGVTFAAFWSTCTVYASRIAPPGMGTTMLMILNALYGGLGQSVGAIIGGKLQSKVGTVQTFLYGGFSDLLLVILVVAYLRIRKGSNFKNPQPIIPTYSTIK